MATYSKILLSSSTQGLPIKVTATSSTGTNIHTTGVSSSVFDEIWLYATNTSTSQVLLTIQFGGTTDPDNDIQVYVPAQSGLTICVPGICLTGNGATGASVKAYAASANVINIVGYVNRIS